jgi:hypothetical protein
LELCDGVNPFQGAPTAPPCETAILEQGSCGLSVIGDLRSTDHGRTWFLNGVHGEIPRGDEYCAVLGEPHKDGEPRYAIMEKRWGVIASQVILLQQVPKRDDGGFDLFRVEGADLVPHGVFRPADESAGE